MRELITNRHLIVASHRRSGTHLTIDAIRNNFPEFHRPVFVLDRLRTSHAKHLSLVECRRILSEPAIIKTHASAEYRNFFENDADIIAFVADLFRQSKIIYVLRDGRDVLTSLFHYGKIQSPDNPDPQLIRSLSFSQFIRMGNDYDGICEHMNRIEYWDYHVRDWLRAREEYDILLLSFDELKSAFSMSVSRIADFLGVPAPPSPKPTLRSAPPLLRHLPDNQMIKNLLERAYRGYQKVVHGIKYSSVAFRSGSPRLDRFLFSNEDLELFDRLTDDFMATRY